MFKKIILFLQETKKEFRHINWPTPKETRRLTLIVVGLSLAVAAFLGILDFIFSYLLNEFFIS